MGRRAPRSRIDWEGIKADYCDGVLSSSEIAAKWRVHATSIRSKATREQWNTPARFKQAVDKVASMAQDAAERGLRRAAEDPDSPEGMALEGLKVLQPAANGVDPLEYQRTMAIFATKLATSGLKRMGVPKTVKDIATLDTLARRALGLDGKAGGGAAAMIRITGGANGPMDIAVGVQGPEGPDEFLDGEE